MPILEKEHPAEGDKMLEGKYIRIRNLPWTACRPDIRDFFSGLSIREGGIMVRNSEAFVSFENPSDARLALYRRNILLHGCKMELSVVNEKDLTTILNNLARRKLNFDRTDLESFATTRHYQAPLRRKIRPTRVSKDGGTPDDQASVFQTTEETEFSDHGTCDMLSSDRRYLAAKRTVNGVKKVHPTHVSRSIKIENYAVFHPAECYNAKRRRFTVE